MISTLVPAAKARVTETPNAVMTTLASPTQGGTSNTSLWRVVMRGGQTGPLHSFDVEQAWHVLAGSATITLGTERIELGVGDTLVVPAASPRQVATDTGVTFVVSGAAAGMATPLTPEGEGTPVAPAWIA